MQRLLELLHSDSGRVTFSLDFARKNGVVCITGEFKADLELVCQRCLQAFATELTNTVKTGIAADEAQIQQIGEDCEPLIVSEKRLLLARFLEDEMLLSMPLAAAHALEICPGEKLLNSMLAKKENPFLALKDLKIKDD